MNRIVYGPHQFEYTLEFAQRKTIAITVNPDMSVQVCAPFRATQESIERILHRRALWVIRQQRFFEQFQPRTPPREYIGGETHLYLGRRYRLRLIQCETPSTALRSGYICVSTSNPKDTEQVKSCLDTWYRERASIIFPERLRLCHKAPAFQHLPQPQLSIRKMTRRWGSCSASQRIIINTDLIRAPRTCIDYVVTHELCHLIHPNHSAQFYSLLTSIMEDWEEQKMRLERLAS